MQNRNEENESQITGLSGILSTQFFANKIFSLLSQPEIDALHQVSKPVSQAITLHFFRHEPQNTKRRSSIFQFLSDTNRSLPQDVQPERLFKALSIYDRLEDYLASLHHLLVHFNLETNLSQGIINHLIKETGELLGNFNVKIAPYLAPFFTEAQSIKFLSGIQSNKALHNEQLHFIVALLPRITKENKLFLNHLELMNNVAAQAFTRADQAEHPFLYQRFIRLLFEYDYANTYIEEIKSIVAHPFARNKISFALARILIGGLSGDAFNQVNLYNQVTQTLDDLTIDPLYYSELMSDNCHQQILIVDKLERLLKLMERSIDLLSKKQQNSLAIKITASLPLVQKKSATDSSRLCLSMIYILTQILQKPHNKALLTPETKNQLIDFFRPSGKNDSTKQKIHFLLVDAFDTVLKNINMGSATPFYLSDIISVADLKLSQHEPFMLSCVINDYVKHRRPYFYQPLKAIYISYLKNAENFDEKLADNFLKLTKCFYAELSKEESDLALDILIKLKILPSCKDKKDNFFCLIELSRKTDENRLTNIKQLVMNTWLDNRHDKNQQFMFEQLTIHLMMKAKNSPSPSTAFQFNNQDINVLTHNICIRYIQHNSYVNGYNFKPFIVAFLKILNDNELKEFATQVKHQLNTKGSQSDADILIMHLIAKKFKERSIANDASKWFEKNIEENVTFVINLFKRTNAFDVSYRLSLVVLENDFDVTDLITEFLNHYSVSIEKEPNVNFIQNCSDYGPNLMKRMNNKQLFELRNNLVKIVSKNEDGEKNNIVDLLKSAIFLTYDPDFDCLGALQPLFDCRGTYQFLLNMASIICWQLLCKNKPNLKTNSDKKSHLIHDLIEWIADKSQAIHKQYQLAATNQQAPCLGNK